MNAPNNKKLDSFGSFSEGWTDSMDGCLSVITNVFPFLFRSLSVLCADLEMMNGHRRAAECLDQLFHKWDG